MYAWLSRIMVIVFVLNVLSPAYAQAPLPRRRTALPPSVDPVAAAQLRADSAAVVRDRVIAARQEYLDSIVPQREDALNAFLSAATFEEMEAAYAQMDKIRRTGSGVMSNYQREITASSESSMRASSAVTYEYYQQNPHVAPDAVSQTMGFDARFGSRDPKWFPIDAANYGKMFRRNGCPSSSDFLDKLKNNQFESSEELVEYIDPAGFNCDDYLAVAYAAETLYYVLEELARAEAIQPEQREEMSVFFSHLKFRASKALQRLNGVKATDETLYMARGTVRILLAILQNAASANNLPLLEKKLYLVSPTEKQYNLSYPKPAAKNMRRDGDGMFLSFPVARPSFEEFVLSQVNFFETLPAGAEEYVSKGLMKVEEVTYSSLPSSSVAQKAALNFWKPNGITQNRPAGAVQNPLAVLGQGQGNYAEEFLQELRAFKAAGPSAESKEFELLKLDVQYAAQFAVLSGNPGMLKEMRDMFDTDEKKFNTRYSPVESVLFNAVYETLRGFNVSNGYIGVFEFLKQSAGPDYGVTVRALALGTLGKLTEPTKATYEANALRAEFVTAESGEQSNKYWLSYEDRFNMAKYVADIYGPLQNTSRYGMEDYGLDSQGMVKLSNNLSTMYMNFMPMEAPTVTLGRCGRVENVDFDNRIILTPEGLKQSDYNIFDADCQFRYSNGGIFVFNNTTPSAITEMHFTNYINSRKYEQEITNKGMEIFGEALAWVVGGAVAGAAFRALRLLGGVAKSLPRAIKAGKLVYNTSKGTRVYRATAAVRRANASIKVGSKYMTQGNFTAHLAQNGMSIETDILTSPAPKSISTAVGPKLPPSPVGKITFAATDATTGAARGMSLPLFSGARPVAKWTVRDRAFALRVAQRMGLRNSWTAADRVLLQEHIMFRPFIQNGTFRHPVTGNFVSGPMLRPDIPLGSLLAEEPILKAGLTAYGKSVRFFTLWKMGDIIGGILWREPFNRWMVRQQEAAVEEEMASLGLSPEAMELEAQNNETSLPGDLLEQVGGEPKESFGWMDLLTLPSWAWQQISPSDMDATDGSLLFPPFMGGRYLLSKMGVGSNPFITQAGKQGLKNFFRREALRLAQIEGAENASATSLEDMLQHLAQDREEVKEYIVFQSADPIIDWAEEKRQFDALFDQYERELRSAGEIDLAARSQALTARWNEYVSSVQNQMQATEGRREAALLSRLNEDISFATKTLREQQENDMADFWVRKYDETCPDIYARLLDSYVEVFAEIAKIQHASSSANEKYMELNKCWQQFWQQRDLYFIRLKQSSNSKSVDAPLSSQSELYPDEKGGASQAY